MHTQTLNIHDIDRSSTAYPTGDASIIRRKNTYFAVAGGTAVLQCAVSPGALIHYYRVSWQNGSRTLFRQSSPSQRNSTFPDSVDPRYRLDPMNLSLIIDDVRRSDSIQDYHCDLQVVDPTNQNTYHYMVANYVNISLTVLCKLYCGCCKRALCATLAFGGRPLVKTSVFKVNLTSQMWL